MFADGHTLSNTQFAVREHEDQSSRIADPRATSCSTTKGDADLSAADRRLGRMRKGRSCPKPTSKKREGLLPAKDGDLAEARDCLQRFATRAWRRPVTDAEIDRYVKLVEERTRGGRELPLRLSRGAGRRAHVEELLLSRRRLADGDASKVNDWELASRLSYFLWSSMPDDELFAAAQHGTLHKPEVLRSQLARMLADREDRAASPSRSRGSGCNCTASAVPARRRALSRLRQVARREHGAGDDRATSARCSRRTCRCASSSISDWTMLNPRLAMHYGLPPLERDRASSA